MEKLKEIKKERVSYLHRTAQPPTLATFRFWGSSAGAGRTRLTRGCKSIKESVTSKNSFHFFSIIYRNDYFCF